ncbi:NAD(P)-binding domain-containing protein [Amycolatopsis sp. NPDC005961]|uniref:NAD(P)-binding domain-containing protein n=1 Tax=Amycolatopsis sp. NPDC005961 TaxID=3156720 RepID=UPI0033C06238
MTTVGILGAGQAGSTLARASIAAGYDVVIANSRAPETLRELVARLGPRARAAHAAQAAAAADIAVTAFPYGPADRLPVEELAGKVVLDTNNYLSRRDGNHPDVDSGLKTIHELRQEQLPASKVLQRPRVRRGRQQPAERVVAQRPRHADVASPRRRAKPSRAPRKPAMRTTRSPMSRDVAITMNRKDSACG